MYLKRIFYHETKHPHYSPSFLDSVFFSLLSLSSLVPLSLHLLSFSPLLSVFPLFFFSSGAFFLSSESLTRAVSASILQSMMECWFSSSHSTKKCAVGTKDKHANASRVVYLTRSPAPLNGNEANLNCRHPAPIAPSTPDLAPLLACTCSNMACT